MGLLFGYTFLHFKGIFTLPGPQKEGQMKLVINLKNLNEWVTAQYFNIEGIEPQRAAEHKQLDGEGITYFIIPIHPSYHSY